MSGDTVGKWAKGEHYGPILSQTDLYLLKVPLELHPILRGEDKFHLTLDLTSGEAGGWNQNERDRNLAFTQRDQPATMPRVEQLIIVTQSSPWCTIVMNDSGVSLGDVCTKLWQDYSQHNITEAEMQSLDTRVQEAVKRTAQNNLMRQGQHPAWGAGGGYYPAAAPAGGVQLKRYDWLRDRTMFDRLIKAGQDNYIQNRLGFTAPNIFVLELMS